MNQATLAGAWTLVGIQFYFVEEKEDILAAPGIYSKGFDKEAYEGRE